MSPSWHSTRYRSSGRGALLTYISAWVALGTLIAGVAIVLLGDDEPTVSLPPVEQTELAQAAKRAECRLRRGGQPPSEQPPVEGRRAAPARAGAYTREQSPPALIGAMRRGAIVMYYRPGIADEQLDRLRQLQRALPRATILVPKTDMPYQFAVTAWRRLLGCPRLDDGTIDAVRLFRGRYVGLGPDAAR